MSSLVDIQLNINQRLIVSWCQFAPQLEVLKMRFQEIVQFLSSCLSGDALVVLTIVIQARCSCCHYLCLLQQVRISVDIFKHSALWKARLRKEFTTKKLITSVGVEVSSAQPIVTDRTDCCIREGQQALPRRTSVIQHSRIFKDIVVRMCRQDSQQRIVCTLSNEVIRVDKGEKIPCCHFYSCVPCSRKTLVFLVDKSTIPLVSCHLFGYLPRGIRRPIINENGLHPLIHLLQYTLQTSLECVFNVIDGDNDRQSHVIIV